MTNNQTNIIAIDLNGTLLKTDSLWEMFFKAISQGNFYPLLWILSGRTIFKNKLANLIDLDLDFLPWNNDVIELASKNYTLGRQIWLATAADKAFAIKVVHHFPFFTNYIASDINHNLIGQAKSIELTKLFGQKGFIYVGNSSADLKVWEAASEAVVVGDQVLTHRVKLVNQKVTILTHTNSNLFTLRSILKLIRIHQWSKNILLFVPLIMAHLFNWPALLDALFSFLAFCFFSSCGYILNDLLDIESDRRHQEKRLRPFAAGTIDPAKGAFLCIFTFIYGLIFSLSVSSNFLICSLIYLLLSIIYSIKLKTMIIIDITILTLLYTLRIFSGGIALNAITSQWLLSFSFFIFAALSLIKRLGEIKKLSYDGLISKTRRPYNAEDAIFFLTLTSGCICSAVLTLAIYVGDELAFTQYRTPKILLLICPILFFWLIRLLKLANEGKMPYDPIFFILKDKTSLICLVLSIILYLIATLGINIY
jgi:4-hydroxybenzoate polyprenyltransferase